MTESLLIQLHKEVWLDDDILNFCLDFDAAEILCSLSYLIQERLEDATSVGITTQPHRKIWTLIKRRRTILRTPSLNWSVCRAVMINEALDDHHHARHARKPDVGLSREDMFGRFFTGAEIIPHMAEHEALAVTTSLVGFYKPLRSRVLPEPRLTEYQPLSTAIIRTSSGQTARPRQWREDVRNGMTRFVRLRFKRQLDNSMHASLNLLVAQNRKPCNSEHPRYPLRHIYGFEETLMLQKKELEELKIESSFDAAY